MGDFTGDVEFQALGKAWTLKMGTKAMRKIEGATGKPMPVIGRELSNEETASIDLVTKVFWGALQHHHPDAHDRQGHLRHLYGRSGHGRHRLQQQHRL